MNGASWQLVAILSSAIVALVGAIITLVVVMFRTSNRRVEDLAGVLASVNEIGRERVAKVEARVEIVSAKIGDLDAYYRHNIPELFAKWEQHCLADKKGAS